MCDGDKAKEVRTKRLELRSLWRRKPRRVPVERTLPGFGGSVLGTAVPSTWPSAHRTCPQTLAAVLTALPRSSPAELTISALSLALLVPVKELNVRFRDRLPTPIPGEIVMVRMTPGSPPLHRTDPAHPVGTGRCRPLVECREVTAERSCLQVYFSRPPPRTL